MTSRLVNPYQEFRDNSGKVLSSGTITFYVNGDVNTQKNIYTTDALTTAQSNPYTLDAYGRVIGDVWLDGEYTIVVKDSDGNTVRTVNDVQDLGAASGGGSEVVQGSVQNKFTNGACRVASEGGSVSISGSYQEGGVANISVKAQGTPTNGTVDLTKYADCGTSGYTLAVTDLTTGSGGTVDYRFRFNSVDSRDLVDGAAIFQCNVLQNTGAAKTYTISVYKATAEDNFTSTTLISASSGTSVSDSTDTKISFSVADMGSCENGIEIIVSCACGAVTTKDFYMNDIVWRKGQAEITFEQEPYAADYSHVKFAEIESTVDTIEAAYLSAISLGLNYKSGLAVTHAADAEHDMTIASGKIVDDTQAYFIQSASAITKRIDATWADGTTNGGCSNAADSGAVQANTWYGLFLLSKSSSPSSCDAIFAKTKANALADTNVVTAGYNICRLVGYARTDGSANIITRLSDGQNSFLWDVMKSETISANTDQTAVTVQCPPFQVARVQYSLAVTVGGAATYGVLTQVGQTSTAPSSTYFQVFQDVSTSSGVTQSIANINIKTNGSSQINHEESATTSVTAYLLTHGYFIDLTITDLV